MGEEPEIYVVNFSDTPGTAEYRERIERARTEGRQRYRDHLATVFDLHDFPAPDAFADIALDALTVWRYIESDESCSCSCHPRLPESDFHDYGFGCVCAQTPEDRHRSFNEWRNANRTFWRSPERPADYGGRARRGSRTRSVDSNAARRQRPQPRRSRPRTVAR